MKKLNSIAILLYCIETQVGGIVSGAKYLRDRLIQMGYVVDIFFIANRPSPYYPPYDLLREGVIHPDRVPFQLAEFGLVIILAGTYWNERIEHSSRKFAKYDRRFSNFYRYIENQISCCYVVGIIDERQIVNNLHILEESLRRDNCLGIIVIAEGMARYIDKLNGKDIYILPTYPVAPCLPSDFRDYYRQLPKKSVIVSSSRITRFKRIEELAGLTLKFYQTCGLRTIVNGATEECYKDHHGYPVAFLRYPTRYFQYNNGYKVEEVNDILRGALYHWCFATYKYPTLQKKKYLQVPRLEIASSEGIISGAVQILADEYAPPEFLDDSVAIHTNLRDISKLPYLIKKVHGSEEDMAVKAYSIYYDKYETLIKNNLEKLIISFYRRLNMVNTINNNTLELDEANRKLVTECGDLDETNAVLEIDDDRSDDEESVLIFVNPRNSQSRGLLDYEYLKNLGISKIEKLSGLKPKIPVKHRRNSRVTASADESVDIVLLVHSAIFNDSSFSSCVEFECFASDDRLDKPVRYYSNNENSIEWLWEDLKYMSELSKKAKGATGSESMFIISGKLALATSGTYYAFQVFPKVWKDAKGLVFIHKAFRPLVSPEYWDIK